MTAQHEAAFDFDESFATGYDAGIRRSCPSYDALHRMIVPWLAGLPADAHFLSAGAGTGAEIVTLGERFPGWRFVAVDPSRDMLGMCRRRANDAGMAARVSYFEGRLEDYRPEAPFHAASSVFVAHFIHGREAKLAYFRAIAASLAPGGTLIFADLFGDRRAPGFAPLFDAWLRSYGAQGIAAEQLAQDRAKAESAVDFVPEDELHALLGDAGFAAPLRFFQTFLFGGWVTTRRA
ncbi:MAG: methyltransferase domain-containing protein [Burkholderiales bacterium]